LQLDWQNNIPTQPLGFWQKNKHVKCKMNAVTYFSGMVFLPAFSVFPRGQFFIVERSLEKKKSLFYVCILLAKEKVPHVAIVFSFQCTKKK
jgi:hypothetical protein